MSQAPVAAEAAEFALPAKQARSRATRDALIEAGIRLVEERDFDTLSIAEIAAAAGCSVGAFYFRFADKDAYFRALIAATVEDGLALFEALAATPAERLVGRLVALTLKSYRRRRGLLRAAIRASMRDATVWDPLKARGHAIADAMVDKLAGSGAGRKQRAARIRFALQTLYGTLNNAILLAPGPLQLGDPALEDELHRMFERIIAP